LKPANASANINSYSSQFHQLLIREQDEQTRDGGTEELFWHLDEEIGEGCLFGEQASIRLKTHVAPERYHHTSEHDEVVPLEARSGTRIYVMAKPYILELDYRLTVGLYSQPTEQGAIGEVASSAWVGMRQRDIGQSQAWYYPEERTLVLWECFLEHWYRQEDPRTDETLRVLWQGFEAFLLRQFPDAAFIATPSWEPIYEDDKDAWPEFLERMGYTPIGSMALGKEVSADEGEEKP